MAMQKKKKIRLTKDEHEKKERKKKEEKIAMPKIQNKKGETKRGVVTYTTTIIFTLAHLDLRLYDLLSPWIHSFGFAKYECKYASFHTLP